MEQIVDILQISKDALIEDLEKLRKNQFILMSPQRQEDKLLKIYEILPEGIEKIDKTETEGFDNTNVHESKSNGEIFSLIDEIMNEIQNLEMDQPKKDSITGKLSKLKDRLEI